MPRRGLLHTPYHYPICWACGTTISHRHQPPLAQTYVIQYLSYPKRGQHYSIISAGHCWTCRSWELPLNGGYLHSNMGASHCWTSKLGELGEFPPTTPREGVTPLPAKSQGFLKDQSTAKPVLQQSYMGTSHSWLLVERGLSHCQVIPINYTCERTVPLLTQMKELQQVNHHRKVD